MAKRRVENNKVKVIYDGIGKTLTVWFDNPNKEYICQETDDDLILMKDKEGNAIGFEMLNFDKRKQRFLKEIALSHASN